jgi:hypothetical protein
MTVPLWAFVAVALYAVLISVFYFKWRPPGPWSDWGFNITTCPDYRAMETMAFVYDRTSYLTGL